MPNISNLSRRRIRSTGLLLAATAVLLTSSLTHAQITTSPSPQNRQMGNGQPDPGPMSTDQMGGPNRGMMDRRFVHKALEGNMTEVELGQLALTKTSNPDIKAFAQKMVDDHTKMGENMKVIARQNGVNIPTRLPKKAEATKAKLAALDGEAFDKAYVKDMLEDHEQDEKEFKNESQMAQIVDVKSTITKDEMVIRMHLEMIRKLAASEGLKTD